MARDEIAVVQAYGRNVVAAPLVTGKTTSRICTAGGIEDPIGGPGATNRDGAVE